MSARELEAFLARIYVDEAARAAFQANPRGEAARAGISEDESTNLETMDWVALELAARSYTNKRKSKLARKENRSILKRYLTFLSGLPRRLWFHS